MAKVNQNTPIVFFGSGPVALASLQNLSEHFQIEAVITKPATENEMRDVLPDVRAFSVSTASELEDLIETQLFRSKIGVLVDFGVIVSGATIDYFPLGIVNSHFSLLPEWRGADPITFSVLSGQAKTGVSLMLLDEKMDTGKLLTQKSMKIAKYVTTPELTAQLVALSNSLLNDYLPKYISGKIKPRAQPHPSRATYSKKITKQDGIIDWSKSSEEIEREVRAYTGWPGSRTTMSGKDVIVTKAHLATKKYDELDKPGLFRSDNKQIVVSTGKGYLVIVKLRPAGKNEMSAEAFIAGHKNFFKKD